MYVLGIDPGKDGGLAGVCVYPDGLIVPDMVAAMPLTPDGWPDIATIMLTLTSAVLLPLSSHTVCFLEKVGAMPPITRPGQRPRSAGAQSSFNFGKGVGYLMGALAAAQIPVTEVRPQEWKKSVLAGTDHSKAEAAAWAYRTYPSSVVSLKRPRGGPHLGKIEALCIATYGARVLLGQKG